MKKKNQVLATEDDILVDLTFHSVPASLLSEFAEKIVRPYYQGNMNATIQDLLHKTLARNKTSFYFTSLMFEPEVSAKH